MIAKLRVGWMLAGWSPGVLTMRSSSWFQATTIAPDRPSARGGAGLALLVATALIAVVATRPSTMPSAATRAIGDFFICFSLSGCRREGPDRRLLQLLFETARGPVEQVAGDRIQPSVGEQPGAI